MDLSLKKSSIVKPSEPTWTGTLVLSELDQVGIVSPLPTVHFYRTLPPDFSPVQTLEHSLSKALVHFYPLAGRLRRVGCGRLELHCNAAGVLFEEMETQSALDDFLGNEADRERLAPSVDHDLPVEELPVMLVKLTRFGCGSICLGVAVSHAVADGQTAFHLMKEWSGLSRGEPFGSPPSLDKSALRAGVPPAGNPRYEHREFGPLPELIGGEREKGKVEKTAVAKLKLTKTQVEMLEKKANGDPINRPRRPYSRYETLAAHIWRSVCRARGHMAEQQTVLGICVSIRRRVNPPLPQTYFGYGALDVNATAVVGELLSRPLSHVAGRIREAIQAVTDDYVQSAIDFLKAQPNLKRFQTKIKDNDEGPLYNNPNLKVVSLLQLPSGGFDFGWGGEANMGPGSHYHEGEFLIVSGNDEDEPVIVSLCLQDKHAQAFKEVFYELI